jgi:hypothetical protein
MLVKEENASPALEASHVSMEGDRDWRASSPIVFVGFANKIFEENMTL